MGSVEYSPCILTMPVPAHDEWTVRTAYRMFYYLGTIFSYVSRTVLLVVIGACRAIYDIIEGPSVPAVTVGPALEGALMDVSMDTAPESANTTEVRASEVSMNTSII